MRLPAIGSQQSAGVSARRAARSSASQAMFETHGVLESARLDYSPGTAGTEERHL